MIRIMIIGTADEKKIKEKYKEFGARLDFNLPVSTSQECDRYDAVFFTGCFDESLLKPWMGNNHLRIARDEKALFAELSFFFGDPQPLEIERKFLVQKPDSDLLKSITPCRSIEISQCYCRSKDGKFRVRRRENDGSIIYIRTEKIKISDLRRIEIEKYISADEYKNCIIGGRVLSKTRYCFLYKDKYFELDIFPFWDDTAVLELELKNEEEEFELPDFLNVIREVTAEPEYRNSAIARKYGMIINEE